MNIKQLDMNVCIQQLIHKLIKRLTIEYFVNVAAFHTSSRLPCKLGVGVGGQDIRYNTGVCGYKAIKYECTHTTINSQIN